MKRNGGHAAGNPLLPAVALVNDLPRGIKAGQFITTGTYTGMTFAKWGRRWLWNLRGLGRLRWGSGRLPGAE